MPTHIPQRPLSRRLVTRGVPDAFASEIFGIEVLLLRYATPYVCGNDPTTARQEWIGQFAGQDVGSGDRPLTATLDHERKMYRMTATRRNSPALGLTDDGEKGLVSHLPVVAITEPSHWKARFVGARSEAISRRPVRMSSGSYSSERKHSWPRNACFDSICLRMNFPKQGRLILGTPLSHLQLEDFRVFHRRQSFGAF